MLERCCYSDLKTYLGLSLLELAPHLPYHLVAEGGARGGGAALLVQRGTDAAQRRQLLAQRHVHLAQRTDAVAARLPPNKNNLIHRPHSVLLQHTKPL